MAALAAAIDDARGWMSAWHVDELSRQWAACAAALDAATAAIPRLLSTAGDTTELEVLLLAVADAIDPLVAFGDAERAWRARWRVPQAPTVG